ncbi:MAG: glycosyltransferase [Gammaproteobacteria bacterium]|nr:glycosyltransferase [Gammaproteobacteria bacterium]MYB39635.1 glycosyltransferase [Gammaproteobacteria bacterium]
MTPCVVIPLRNDATALGRAMADLSEHAAHWPVLVVDGGSTDGGAALAEQLMRDGTGGLLLSAPGRGQQLRLGAECAIERGHDWLWFLHADSRVSARLVQALEAIADRPAWGRCDVAFEVRDWRMGIVAKAMNLRSAATHICTGDQGMFVHRRLLEAVGGVPEQPLMEDIELARRLRRVGVPIRVRTPLVTSARRWQREGLLATVLQMWALRARYWLGESAEALARDYYGPYP